MTEVVDHDDNGEEIGELIQEPRLMLGDSEIRPGDRIIFRFRHAAFAAQGGSTELAGVVCYVLPGFELVYLVKVMGGVLPWPDLLVARRDVLRVRI
jgi:hypothetical protein